jgi:hypothetical protein
VRTIEPDSGNVPVDLVLDRLGFDHAGHRSVPPEQ